MVPTAPPEKLPNNCQRSLNTRPGSLSVIVIFTESLSCAALIYGVHQLIFKLPWIWFNFLRRGMNRPLDLLVSLWKYLYYFVSKIQNQDTYKRIVVFASLFSQLHIVYIKWNIPIAISGRQWFHPRVRWRAPLATEASWRAPTDQN